MGLFLGEFLWVDYIKCIIINIMYLIIFPLSWAFSLTHSVSIHNCITYKNLCITWIHHNLFTNTLYVTVYTDSTASLASHRLLNEIYHVT